MESGFWASSAGLAGPGSLLLRSAPTTLCNAAKLPIATAVFPMKLRRVNSLIIISPEGFEFVFGIEVVHVRRATLGTRWRSGPASDRSKRIGFPPHDCVGRRVHRSRRLDRDRKIGVVCGK